MTRDAMGRVHPYELADRVGHGRSEDERTDEIEDGCHRHRGERPRDPWCDEDRDRVRGVVEPHP